MIGIRPPSIKRIPQRDGEGRKIPAAGLQAEQLIDFINQSHVNLLLGVPHPQRKTFIRLPSCTASSLRLAIHPAPVDELLQASVQRPHCTQSQMEGDNRSSSASPKFTIRKINLGSNALRSPATGQELLHSPQVKQLDMSRPWPHAETAGCPGRGFAKRYRQWNQESGCSARNASAHL